ncbi:MAG: transposase [Candidatus Kerfeldbacteria bacterium]|nr:transposase [Candidatus Kerfeldbacteria bacterium]
MQQQKQKRKAYLSDITEKQFQLIEPLVRRRRKKRGRPPAEMYEVVNGMLYVLSTGCRWRDLPHDYGVSYVTCYRQFIKWVNDGTFRKIFEELKHKADKKNILHWRNAYLDASDVKSKKGANGTAVIQENTR